MGMTSLDTHPPPSGASRSATHALHLCYISYACFLYIYIYIYCIYIYTHLSLSLYIYIANRQIGMPRGLTRDVSTGHPPPFRRAGSSRRRTSPSHT